MSLLSLVQDAMVLCGFREPETVYSNTNDVVKHFLRLSQIEGDALARRADWRGLKVLGTLTGDGTSTDFTLPADFSKFADGYPMWKDGTPSTPLLKASDDLFLAMKVAVSQPTIPYWRLFGESIEFYPVPPAGDVYKLEYRSSYWISDENAATRRRRWAADTDFAVIPEELITLGLVWRYKASKGFDYAEDFRTYQIEVAKFSSVDDGRQTLTARANFAGDYFSGRASDAVVIP